VRVQEPGLPRDDRRLARIAHAGDTPFAETLEAAREEGARGGCAGRAGPSRDRHRELGAVLTPDRVVVGGGVAGPRRPAPDRSATGDPPDQNVAPLDSISIVRAELGPFAGAIGAALGAGRSVKTPGRRRRRDDRSQGDDAGDGPHRALHTMTLHGKRGRDKVQVVYSAPRSGEAFARDWGIGLGRPRGGRASRHRGRRRSAERPASRRSSWRRGTERRFSARSRSPGMPPGERILDVVEDAGVCGTSRTSCTRRRRSRPSGDSGGQIGQVTWAGHETHRAAQRLVLGRRAGRRMPSSTSAVLRRDHSELRARRSSPSR
jgi:hypothetical protein